MSLVKACITLLILLAGASALTCVANTSDGTMLLVSERYTAKLDMKGNRMSIGNILDVYQFPKAVVLGAEVESLEPSTGNIVPGQEVREFIVSYPAGFKEDMYVSSRLDFKEKYIHHEIKLENTHGSKLRVRVRLSPSTNDSYYVYAPFVTNPAANHMWVSPPFNEERGAGVAIYFDTLASDYIQLAEVSIENNPLRLLQWEVEVPPGETEVISMRYIVGYASDAELMGQHAFNPPATKQHLLDTETDPLFDLSGRESLKQWKTGISASSSAEVIEKVRAELDQLGNTPTSESYLENTSYDFQELVEKSQLDSVEKSLIFMEVVRKKGVPAELRIGKRGGLYYAWVYAYPTIEPSVYDPVGKRKDYDEVYVEPSPVYCGGSIGSCNWGAGLETGLVCFLNVCVSVYILTALVLLLVIGAFLLLQYKADFFYKRAKRAKPTTAKPAAMSYEIIKKDHVATNPLEEAVFRELTKRMGIVELTSYEKQTGFSQLLIKTTLEELESKGVIKRQ